MEIIKVAEEIERRINALAIGRKELAERGKAKAEALADYDRELAKAIIKLGSDSGIEFEGQILKNMPATVRPKVAQGICWEWALKKDLAEAQYRNAIAGMSALEAELNAYQSLFRYLNEV